MSNRVYESFLKSGLPKRPDGKSYSPTAYNVYRTICYRYNEKTGTAYPGEKELKLITGVSRQSVSRAVKELKVGGLIDQPKAGYRNQRAEFRPIYHLARLSNSDNPALHNTENKETGSQLESDVPIIGKSKSTDHKETGFLVPISTVSSSKYANSNNRLSTETKSALKVNGDRWHFISQDLDPYVKRKWSHSVESEKLLDVIESLPGWSLQRLQTDFGALIFSSSYDNCGLLMAHIRALAGVVSAPKTVPKETPTISNEIVNVLSDVFALPKDL
jgi:hypothetical protein